MSVPRQWRRLFQSPYFWGRVFSFPLFLCSALFGCLGIFGLLCFSDVGQSFWPRFFLPQLLTSVPSFNTRASLVVGVLLPPSVFVWGAMFGFAGVVFWLARLALKRSISFFVHREERAKCIALLLFSASLVVFAAVPTVRANVVLPLNSVSRYLNSHAIKTTEVAAIGLRSPALSTALGGLGLRQFHKGNETPFASNEFRAIVLPIWLKERCAQFGWQAEVQYSIWTVCVRSKDFLLKN